MTKDAERREAIREHFQHVVFVSSMMDPYTFLEDALGHPANWQPREIGFRGMRFSRPDASWEWYSDDNHGSYFFFKNVTDAVEFKLRFG